MDGGEFVCERLVAGEVNVLVGVCRLAVDVKIERAIRIADDCDIEHGYAVVPLDFFSPLYVWVYGVEIVVKRKDVVVVDGCDGVVGLPKPKQDEVTGTGVVVASGVVGEGSFLEVFHENVR